LNDYPIKRGFKTMNRSIAKIAALMAAFPVFAGDFDVRVDYAKAGAPLDINGRTIAVAFGGLLLGYRFEVKPGSSIDVRLGRGYDPSVSGTFLNVEASGSATCDVFAVGWTQQLTKVSSFDISSELSYQRQRVHADTTGFRRLEPFLGTIDLNTDFVTASLLAQTAISDRTSIYGKFGAQYWRLGYEAFGSVANARIWTESSVSGISPTLAIGVKQQIGEYKVGAELSAYQFQSDNKVWVPGVSLAVARVW
jgi:hypothetical protein